MLHQQRHSLGIAVHVKVQLARGQRDEVAPQGAGDGLHPRRWRRRRKIAGVRREVDARHRDRGRFERERRAQPEVVAAAVAGAGEELHGAGLQVRRGRHGGVDAVGERLLPRRREHVLLAQVGP